MSLTNPNKVVTEQRLSEFYQGILPYLGGVPGSSVYVWDSGSTAVTGNKFAISLSEIPTISVGDILVLGVHANHTFSGSTGAGWGFAITSGGATTNWSNDIFRTDITSSSSPTFWTEVFRDNIPIGTTIVLVCTSKTGTIPNFLLVATQTSKTSEQSVTLSTSGTTTVTFSRSDLTTSSMVDIGVSEWGLVPDDVVVSNGSCTVTMPQVDSARTVNVRLIVK